MSKKITIVPYNPEWPSLFEIEKQIIGKALMQLSPVIEHVGSTSVVGLGAKPIIDIMVGLPEESLLDAVVAPMLSAGYCYVSYYEGVMPYRRYFIKMDGYHGQHYRQESERPGRAFFPSTHHIHIVIKNSEFWQRHLFFRDYLRTHPEERDAYYELKLKLSKKEWNDRNDYTDAKSAFIQRIEGLKQ